MQEIRVSHICKSYGTHVVFHDLSLVIPQNGITCIMAPSGAGKTTLLRILMGLEKPDEGRIEGLEGKKCSAVFQEPRLCENLSALTNIRMVRRKKFWEKGAQDFEQISKLMGKVGLSGWERQPVKEMSGGMRQRVALLRALYATWDILFLDEPFHGLDQNCLDQAMDVTKQLCAGKTVILVTHSIKEAQEMGNIIELPISK